MRVHNYTEKEAIEDAPGVVRRVVIGVDEGAPRFSMRTFELAPGSSTPFHSHWWEHEVYVLSGDGIVRGKESEQSIAQGTVVFVAPDEEHCFANSGDDVLRFVCVIPLPEAAPR